MNQRSHNRGEERVGHTFDSVHHAAWATQRTAAAMLLYAQHYGYAADDALQGWDRLSAEAKDGFLQEADRYASLFSAPAAAGVAG